jgi:hypothetical protein
MAANDFIAENPFTKMFCYHQNEYMPGKGELSTDTFVLLMFLQGLY